MNYFEARVGGGIAYEVSPGLSVQAEGVRWFGGRSLFQESMTT